MAIITVTMLEGRDSETKDQLIKGITDSFINVAGARPEQVRVVINEVTENDYGVGGKSLAALSRDKA